MRGQVLLHALSSAKDDQDPPPSSLHSSKTADKKISALSLFHVARATRGEQVSEGRGRQSLMTGGREGGRQNTKFCLLFFRLRPLSKEMASERGWERLKGVVIPFLCVFVGLPAWSRGLGDW